MSSLEKMNMKKMQKDIDKNVGPKAWNRKYQSVKPSKPNLNKSTGKSSRKPSKLHCTSSYVSNHIYNEPDFTIGSDFCKTLDINEGKILGEGSYGLTKLRKIEDKDYAVKFICKDKFDMREAELLAKLSSSPLSRRYIGIIVEYCASRNYGVIIMEPLYGGDLYNISSDLKYTKVMAYKDVKSSIYETNVKRNFMKIMGEVLEGLEFLHSNGIVHHDIKGENIMFSKDPRDTNNWCAKYIDFGLACVEKAKPIMYDYKGESYMTKIKQCSLPNDYGTRSYFPPEVVFPELVKLIKEYYKTIKDGYWQLNEKFDVWCLGITLLSLFDRRLVILFFDLVNEKDDINRAIELAWEKNKNILLPHLRNVPLPVKNLVDAKYLPDFVELAPILTNMLNLSPKHRWSVDKCLREFHSL